MRNSIVTCTNNKNSSSWNISQARTLLLLLITLLAFNDMVTNKSILTTVILISYWSYAMAWLSLIRTYPIEGQANKRAANATKLIHQSKHSQVRVCICEYLSTGFILSVQKELWMMEITLHMSIMKSFVYKI